LFCGFLFLGSYPWINYRFDDVSLLSICVFDC